MASHYEDIRDLLKTKGLILAIDALRGTIENFDDFKEIADILINAKSYLPFRTHSAIDTFYNSLTDDVYDMDISYIISILLEILSLVI